MARYVYDENKVNEAIDTLNNATKKLSTTASSFSSALAEIVSASKNYLLIDTQTLPAMPEQVISTIDEIVNEITEKSVAIEEYNASPWYEKIFGSAGMIFTKLGEGVGTAGEQLLDGAVTIVGFVPGLFSSDIQSSVSEFVEKDYVGDFFYDQYETGALKWINDKSYFSHTDTAANVFKGVGVATGYVLTTAAAGGVVGAARGSGMAAGAASGVSSLGLNTAVAGLGGMGSGTQSGLQNNLSFNEAASQGLKQGAIQAGTVFVAGRLAKKYTSVKGSNSTELSVVDDSTKLSTNTSKSSSILQTRNGSSGKVGQVLKNGDDTIEFVKLSSKGDQYIVRRNGSLESINVNTGQTSWGETLNLSRLSNIKNTRGMNLSSPISNVSNTSQVVSGPTLQSPRLPGTVANSSGIFRGLRNGVRDVGNAILNGANAAIKNPATISLAAGSANQAIVQNANSQFKTKMDPENHIGLNTDYSEKIVAKNKTPEQPNQDTSSSVFDTTPIQPVDTEQPLDVNQSTGGGQASNYKVVDNGNASTVLNSIGLRKKSSISPDTIINNQITTDLIPNTGNNDPIIPETDIGNNSDSNIEAILPSEEIPSTNPDNGMSGDIIISEEPPVPETPNFNSPTDNVSDNITARTSESIQGYYDNRGSDYTDSLMSDFNNNDNQLGLEGELSFENKPSSEILEENNGINGIGNDSLGVISIDKNIPETPSISGDEGSVIPAILGVGAAGAAGVAGIHYVQNRYGKDNEYYEDESSEENNNDEYHVNSSDSINISDGLAGMVEEIPKYKAGGVNQLKLDDGAGIKINEDDSIIAPQTQELE